MDLETLIKYSEGKTLEYKENDLSRGKILATVIAFANTSGGRLVIGVQEKTHHIIGVENPHEIGEALANFFHDTIEPRIIPNIEVIPYRNKHVLVIDVYPSSFRPHFEKSKGKAYSTYIRIGSTTRLADQALMAVLERSTIRKSFDEEPCYEANCEDIDFTAASQFFSELRSLTTQDFISLGILLKNNQDLMPTVGGVLLFATDRLRYFPDAYVQFGVFEGLDKTHILNSQKITSLFPEAINETLSLIKKHVQVGIKIEEIHHQEVWDIPKVALREALVNAIVHTDYMLRGAPIRVSVFKDRIEIENSGLLPWGLTFEDLKSGLSKLRNPVIGRVFHELGLIEQWGSGIKRIITVCEEAGLRPPVFEEIGARIRVTFLKEKITPVQVDVRDQQILDLIEQRGPLSTQEIVPLVDIGRRAVISRLSRLVDKGFLREQGQSATDPKKKYAKVEK